MGLFWCRSVCLVSIIVKRREPRSEWHINWREGFKIFLINMISFSTSTPTSFSLGKPVFGRKNFSFYFPAGLSPYLLSDKDFWIPCESKQDVLLLHRLSRQHLSTFLRSTSFNIFPKMAMVETQSFHQMHTAWVVFLIVKWSAISFHS